MMQPFHSMNHAVPFVFLGILALLSFWLNEMVKTDPPFVMKEHIPDSYAFNVQMMQLDKNGVLRYQLNAPQMQHFPDDDSTSLENPVLVSLRENSAPVTISAKDAVLTQNGEVVYLYNGTQITRPPFGKRGALKATTPYFVVLPNENYAFTNAPFQMTENEQSWVRSVGAELFVESSVLHLKSKVTSLIQPQLLNTK